MAFHLQKAGQKGLEYFPDIGGGTCGDDLLCEPDGIVEIVKVASLAEGICQDVYNVDIREVGHS